MYEAIVTLVLKERGLSKLHEMPYTEVYRIEFDTEEAMRAWLDTSEHEGVLADQKMGGERVEHQ